MNDIRIECYVKEVDASCPHSSESRPFCSKNRKRLSYFQTLSFDHFNPFVVSTSKEKVAEQLFKISSIDKTSRRQEQTSYLTINKPKFKCNWR